MRNGQYFNDEIISRINDLDEIIVYGAGVMGKALKLCLESEPYNKKICLFIVNDVDRNPEMIGDTPVIAIDKAEEYKDQVIMVALNETHMPRAVETLRVKGFKNLILLNAAGDEWSHIKANYFLSNPNHCYIPFMMIERGCGM